MSSKRHFDDDMCVDALLSITIHMRFDGKDGLVICCGVFVAFAKMVHY